MTDSRSERLEKILKGAFGGPPTPLKDIPTRSGESRKLRRKKSQRRLRPPRTARMVRSMSFILRVLYRKSNSAK
jgi:hypothetical protein